jgi:hypothetical protein
VSLAPPTPREMRAILESRFETVPSAILGRASRSDRDVRAAMGAVNAAIMRGQFSSDARSSSSSNRGA